MVYHKRLVRFLKFVIYFEKIVVKMIKSLENTRKLSEAEMLNVKGARRLERLTNASNRHIIDNVFDCL